MHYLGYVRVWLQDNAAERALRACQYILAFNMVLSEFEMLMKTIHAADVTRTRLTQLSSAVAFKSEAGDGKDEEEDTKRAKSKHSSPEQKKKKQKQKTSSPPDDLQTEQPGAEPGTTFASPRRTVGVGIVSRSAGLITSGQRTQQSRSSSLLFPLLLSCCAH